MVLHVSTPQSQSPSGGWLGVQADTRDHLASDGSTLSLANHNSSNSNTAWETLLTFAVPILVVAGAVSAVMVLLCMWRDGAIFARCYRAVAQGIFCFSGASTVGNNHNHNDDEAFVLVVEEGDEEDEEDPLLPSASTPAPALRWVKFLFGKRTPSSYLDEYDEEEEEDQSPAAIDFNNNSQEDARRHAADDDDNVPHSSDTNSTTHPLTLGKDRQGSSVEDVSRTASDISDEQRCAPTSTDSTATTTTTVRAIITHNMNERHGVATTATPSSAISVGSPRVRGGPAVSNEEVPMCRSASRPPLPPPRPQSYSSLYINRTNNSNNFFFPQHQQQENNNNHHLHLLTCVPPPPTQQQQQQQQEMAASPRTPAANLFAGAADAYSDGNVDFDADDSMHRKKRRKRSSSYLEPCQPVLAAAPISIMKPQDTVDVAASLPRASTTECEMAGDHTIVIASIPCDEGEAAEAAAASVQKPHSVGTNALLQDDLMLVSSAHGDFLGDALMDDDGMGVYNTAIGSNHHLNQSNPNGYNYFSSTVRGDSPVLFTGSAVSSSHASTPPTSTAASRLYGSEYNNDNNNNTTAATSIYNNEDNNRQAVDFAFSAAVSRSSSSDSLSSNSMGSRHTASPPLRPSIHNNTNNAKNDEEGDDDGTTDLYRAGQCRSTDSLTVDEDAVSQVSSDSAASQQQHLTH